MVDEEGVAVDLEEDPDRVLGGDPAVEVGGREILRLRDSYREVAGEHYSVKRFHDTLLRYGGLPVSLARWGMDLAD